MSLRTFPRYSNILLSQFSLNLCKNHLFVKCKRYPNVLTSFNSASFCNTRRVTNFCVFDQLLHNHILLSDAKHKQRDGCLRETVCRNYAKRINVFVPNEPRDMFMGLDPRTPKIGFEKVKELEDAPESVKKLFSLEFGEQKDIKEYRMKKALEVVQKDPTDTDSLPVQIVTKTIHLRDLAQLLPYNRKSKTMRAKILKLMSERKKLLGELRAKDMEMFEKICKDFDITFVLPPRYNHEFSKRQLKKIIVKNEAHELKVAALEEHVFNEREAMLNEVVQLKKELGRELTEEEKERLRTLEEQHDN